MKRFMIFLTFILGFTAAYTQSQAASSEGQQERIRSMGLPSHYEFSLNPMASLTLKGESHEVGGHLALSLYRPFWHPIFGLGLTGEGYLGSFEGEGDVEGGLRALAGVKLLFSQVGLDYSISGNEFDFIASWAFPLERGGIFGHGQQLRLNWIPGRDHSLHLGLNFPLRQPHLGQTRPAQDRVKLPTVSSSLLTFKQSELSPELEQTLELLEHAAEWIARYTTPFFDQVNLEKDEKELEKFERAVQTLKTHLNFSDEFYPQGHSFQAEIETYHQMFEQAFILTFDEAQGTTGDRTQSLRIAEKARELILQDVIMPYNQLLGRVKTPDSLKNLSVQAVNDFNSWLSVTTPLSALQRNQLVTVLQRVLAILEQQRKKTKSIWKDSEVVWIPLQYGLRPEQYDTQGELNALLEQITQQQFSDANQIYYIINEEFQSELTDSILQAQDYHILWIHDYRGVTPEGEPDSIGLRQTVRAYLAALTQAVRNYETTGKIPLYLILLDQYYYESNNGALWMELLQNPLEHEMRLSAKYAYWNEMIQQAQAELRQAVADSALLQQRVRQYGQKWLLNTLKVHVNITNPSDYSFRSAHLIPHIPFAPDDLMRDHRKIVLYDVSEQDPGKGRAIYTGMGVGEHYTGPTWEDRAILVKGPALVSVKDAAREVLVNQGFDADDIPQHLRKQSFPVNYAEMIRNLRKQGWTATVMDLHNQTGFRAKPVNALKASLYSLMPPGSTIIVPDSLWNSPFWGGLLVGAALRGCRVLLIAPALDNAPSDGFPQMSRAQELFTRLILLQNNLQAELDATGGMLKVGVYTRRSDVNDTRAMLNEFRQGLSHYPFLKTIFPFLPEVYAVIEDVDQNLKLAGFQMSFHTEDLEKRQPKLHLKTNFFASASFPDLLAWNGWDQVFNAYLYYRSKYRPGPQDNLEPRNIPSDLRDAYNVAARPYWQSLSEDEQQRAIYYLTVGSQNQDYRGMIMDGEAACVVAGYDSLVAMLDFFFMSGLTTWIDDPGDLEKYLPAQKGWRKLLGRYIMKAL
ncbi:hypothetical protein U27_00428 [Candidatus Vecturithrix granuli]|uniref:Uncharacterized protein n=1 Tax=Vecturithrix granuli TaxID=1499967 RepID=A0A081C7H6_VECG1|nr:hypothetical protein U27_00428 [Candidatus Vecturithrix granuli]